MGALFGSTVSASAIENVAAEWVGFGEGWVVEVLGRVVGHADFLHDAARGEIGRGGEGDYFGEGQRLEAVFEGGEGAFGGEAAVPMGSGESPADFNARGKREFKARDVETDVADAFAGGVEFGGPEAVAMLLEVGLDTVEHGIGFDGGHGGGEVAHDFGVGVEGDEGGPIGGLPRAEEETGGGGHFLSILG